MRKLIGLILSLVLFTGFDFQNTVEQESELKEIRQSLREFEEQFFGLAFDKVAKGMPVFHVSVSKDGTIRKAVYDQKNHQGVFRRAMFSNSNLGWCFSTYIIPSALVEPDDPQGLSRGSPHSVEFVNKNQDAGCLNYAAGDYVFGFAKNRSLTSIADDSASPVYTKALGGVEYKVLRCEGEGSPDIFFYFDIQNRLAFIKEEIRPGDIIGGSATLPSTIAGKGRWTDFLIGPIHYEKFDGRDVVTSYSFSVKADGGVDSKSKVDLTNFTTLDNDLSGRIVLPEFDLKNGQRVNCGKSPMIYEYHNGRIVLAVDERSVAAAQRARYSSSFSGRLRFYTIAGGLLVCVFVFLVWYRNRD
ncbi:MAG: hypothetical protein AB8B55_08465 [Mariniblastus sp.]